MNKNIKIVYIACFIQAHCANIGKNRKWNPLKTFATKTAACRGKVQSFLNCFTVWIGLIPWSRAVPPPPTDCDPERVGLCSPPHLPRWDTLLFHHEQRPAGSDLAPDEERDENRHSEDLHCVSLKLCWTLKSAEQKGLLDFFLKEVVCYFSSLNYLS